MLWRRTPTQLGVNNSNAVQIGGLANNVKFFGSNTAETASSAVLDGGWNSDHTYTVRSVQPWLMYGASSNDGFAGVFAFTANLGGGWQIATHRTILLGY